MKQSIKDIDYHLTKAQEQKLALENYKKLLQELKKDVRSIFFDYFDRYTNNNKKYDILNDKDIIIEKIYDRIRSIKASYTTETGVATLHTLKVKTEYKGKYDEIDDTIIMDEIDNSFYNYYYQYKRQYEAILKANKERLQENSINIQERLENALYDMYNKVKRENLSKKSIIIAFDKCKNEIMNDLEIPITKENDFIYYKTVKKIKNIIPDDPIVKVESNTKEKEKKMPLGWKLYFGLVAIDKIKKHL